VMIGHELDIFPSRARRHPYLDVQG
jgi:hypothetical protein